MPLNLVASLSLLILIYLWLGFVPTPKLDKSEIRLDMKLVANKILNQSNINLSKGPNVPKDKEPYSIPQKLRRKVYTNVDPSGEAIINETVDRLKSDLDTKLLRQPEKRKLSNLTSDEIEGMQWLERNVNNGTIAITKADKGGATLIVYPELLRNMSLEKIQNESLSEKLDKDPTKDLHKKLVHLWIKGKNSALITPKTAYDIMGISDNSRTDGAGPTNYQSTLPHFKPGKPYFYPALKIHKLKREMLKPGIKPPCRLITALQEGVTRRSDVYLADTFLRDLERDFCDDLLIDSTDALKWLETTDLSLDHNLKKRLKAFTYDFEALYDSVDPDLAIHALKTAMDECRSDWTDQFKTWIIDLVKLSFKSSVGQFEGCWYRQKKGVPTGGSLCVQIANIAVYYCLREVVYSDPTLMTNIVTTKRYIDDGGGFFEGTKRQFSDFIHNVNTKLNQFHLSIDEHCICIM